MQRVIKGNSVAQLNAQVNDDWRIVPGSVQALGVPIQKIGGVDIRTEYAAIIERAAMVVEVFEVKGTGERFPFGFRRVSDPKAITEMMDYEAACDFKRDLEALGATVVNLTEYTFEG